MSTRHKKETKNVTVDKKFILEKLHTAFADEWVAAYQYWVSAHFVEGPELSSVQGELEEHYNDEIKHAGMIAERILQLGDRIRMFPKDWEKIGECKFDAISNNFVANVLTENIKGERCAIDYYQEFFDLIQDKDPVTADIVLQILKDEIEHESDLKRLEKAI